MPKLAPRKPPQIGCQRPPDSIRMFLNEVGDGCLECDNGPEIVEPLNTHHPPRMLCLDAWGYTPRAKIKSVRRVGPRQKTGARHEVERRAPRELRLHALKGDAVHRFTPAPRSKPSMPIAPTERIRRMPAFRSLSRADLNSVS